MPAGLHREFVRALCHGGLDWAQDESGLGLVRAHGLWGAALAPLLTEDIARVLFSEAEIQRAVRRIGEQISQDYAGRRPLLVGVLKGSVMVLADLLRAITAPVELDLMAVSSYGPATRSSGVVRILKDLEHSIEGLDVIVFEDIVDTGLTLSYILRVLRARHPASLVVGTLLDKPARRFIDIPLKYRGFEVPDEFVVGYGLDYGEKYRNLPFIGVLKPEVYTRGMDLGL